MGIHAFMRGSMAPPKDHRGDTIPSFSLWQKIQKLPLLLALRESQPQTAIPSPHAPSHNVTAFAVAIGVFRENKGRSWRRATHIAAVRYLLERARNTSDIKFGFRETTAELYVAWARKSGAKVLTNELSEGATLHWIGPRREDRVFLFLHGTPSPPTLGLEEGPTGPFRWSLCHPGPA